MLPAALGRRYDVAIRRLQEADGDVESLPLPVQTLLRVEAAQSIIESGGLAFFYDADFPGQPPYTVFVEAYRRIGADEAADCIEAASMLFPFEEPQLFEPLRQLLLERFVADPRHPFARLSARLDQDLGVWTCLMRYVDDHAEAFAPGSAAR